MAVFVTAIVTYFGAATIGAAVVSAVGVTGLSATAVAAIGAGTIAAGSTALRGGSVSDILKSAVLGGVTSYVGGSIGKELSSVVRAEAIMSGNMSFDVANVVGKVAGAATAGGVSSSIQALASGKDPIDALIKGGLTAGLSAGVSQGVNLITSEIPGFNDLGKNYGGVGEAAQRAITAGLTSGVLGKDVGDAVLNSVVGSVSRAGGDLVKDLTSDLRTAYTDASSTGSALDENYTKQKQIFDTYDATAAEVETKRQEIKDNVDKYLDAKDTYENPKYLSGTEADGSTVYYKNVYGGTVNVRGSYNDDGTYNEPYSYKAADNVVTGTEVIDHGVHVVDMIKYATLVNDAMPGYEKQVADAEKKIAVLSTELGGLKESAAPLEKTLTDQKAVLDTQVKEFLSQEEINAQNIAKAVAEAEAARTRIEAATGTTLTQEQLDAIVNTGNVNTAADDFITQYTGDTNYAVTPVDTTVTTTPTSTVTQPTTTDTLPATVTQPTGPAAISDEEIRDFIATHSEEEIKAAMERTGVTQAQVDAATAVVTPTDVVTTPVAETVAPPASNYSNEVIKAFVDTHTPEEVQAAMLEYGVTQAQIDAATKTVATTTPVDEPTVVQPDTVVAPPSVVDTVIEPPPVVAPVVEPPPVAPTVVEPVVAPPITPEVQPVAPVVAPVIEPVVAPVVAPPVVEPPAYVPPENLIPVTTTLAAAPPAETVTDLEEVFPTKVEPPAPIAPVGGLNTLTEVAESPVIKPTTESPENVAPGGLNAVSGNFVATSPGVQMPDFSKTLGSMATSFLKSKLTPVKRPTTAPKPSSVPRPASTPVGGLTAVKAPVKAAAAPRVDVSKLIPVKKAVAPPKTLPSNAKLTPVKSIANLTSLVKKVG